MKTEEVTILLSVFKTDPPVEASCILGCPL